MVGTVGTVRMVGLPSLSLCSLSYLPGRAGVWGLEVPVREGEGEGYLLFWITHWPWVHNRLYFCLLSA